MSESGAIDEIHQLYRVDPAEFVAARAVLVKALRAAGRRDDARDVVKLRKPTVPAWALNQVAAEHPKLIARAIEAGVALRTATEQTLAGDASGLPDATMAEAAASALVIDAAGALLPALTADLRERMAATLRAAAVDDVVRAELEAGLLSADHEPPAIGFGGTAVTAAEPATPVKAKGKASAAAKLEERPKSKRKIRRVGSPQGAAPKPVDEVDAKRRAKEVERAREEAAERKRQAEAERKRAAERKRQQAALDSAAKAARKRADQLERDATRAEEAAAQARSEADAAGAEATSAEQAAAAGPPD